MPLKLNQGILDVPSGTRTQSRKQTLVDQMGFQFPKSYLSNTSKEETVLEYVEDFRRQYVQVFPDRRPLLLCPKNEAGLRKFVCTTVRPSLLPYDSLYEIEDTAKFVANFLTYLPLDDSTAIPTILVSPSTTIKIRHGDSLDFANLLCSLLRGNGCDAYVVSGYAPKWVTTQDQTQTEYPQLEATQLEDSRKKVKETTGDSKKDADDASRPQTRGQNRDEQKDGSTDQKQERYKIRAKPNTESAYEAFLKRKNKRDEDDKLAVALGKTQFVSNTVEDPLEGVRVHFWVLLLKGRREVARDMFVEPTTGTMWAIEDSPYLGIESLWNEHNYWANVQEEKSPQKMSYTLTDSNSWEYVLIEGKKAEKDQTLDTLNFDAEDKKAEVPRVPFGLKNARRGRK